MAREISLGASPGLGGRLESTSFLEKRFWCRIFIYYNVTNDRIPGLWYTCICDYLYIYMFIIICTRFRLLSTRQQLHIIIVLVTTTHRARLHIRRHIYRDRYRGHILEPV